jgi:hypothetical protein
LDTFLSRKKYRFCFFDQAEDEGRTSEFKRIRDNEQRRLLFLSAERKANTVERNNTNVVEKAKRI